MYFVTIIIPINKQSVGNEREAFMSYLDHVHICIGKSHKKANCFIYERQCILLILSCLRLVRRLTDVLDF